MAKKNRSLTIEGVEYKNPTAAARALVAAGKTLSETAALTGITYQTVYSVTKGAEKVKARRVTYRILSLGKSGKKSVGEIAAMNNTSTSKVIALLKKNSIVVLTKEAKAALVKAKVEAEAAKKAAKAAVKPVKASKSAKASKAVKVELIDPIVPAEDFADVNSAMTDEAAMQAALADMPFIPIVA
jgi:predicted transcriptional regulator